VIYEVRHVTTYLYGAPVSFARSVLRLVPVDRPGQVVHSATLLVQPQPAMSRDGTDYFGNATRHIVLTGAHRELKITLMARIAVDAPPLPDPEATPPVEAVAAAAARDASLAPDAPAQMLFASRFVPLVADVTAWAGASFSSGRPVLAGAMDLMRRIRREFAYDPAATDVTTPLAEAFGKKRGVCQDFAQVMIAGLRGLGIPAAYVSGYLRTVPPPGRPRLAGADATHAWVKVWCGSQTGWVGLDPTNAMAAGNDHIVLATGRDYADVSPVDGSLTSAGNQKMTVAVDVVPADTVRAVDPGRVSAG
jgi:transglutaminase-like putative cysteine protease